MKALVTDLKAGQCVKPNTCALDGSKVKGYHRLVEVHVGAISTLLVFEPSYDGPPETLRLHNHTTVDVHGGSLPRL